MDPIALDLGIVVITWYALFIVTGMIVGLSIATKEAKKHNIDAKLLEDFMFWVLICGFIGARTWYVLFSLPYYLPQPLQIFAIWNGGLAIHGGILGGLLYTIYFCKKHNIYVFKLSDIAIPGLLFAQSLGRWGNFMNSEAHGGQTTYEFLKNTMHLPDFIVNGMYIDGVYYQPTFLYESIWNITGFLILMLVLRKKWRFDYGKITAFYFMWYGFIRVFIEQMRTDALMFGPIKIAQLTSLCMFIGGIILFVMISRRNKND